MASPYYPPVPQPVMDTSSGAVTAVIDNRTDLPDEQVREVIQDRWVEIAGFQLAQPSTFQLYQTSYESSMLARTPFKTPNNTIDEIRLARSVADTDDDVASAIGQMLAIAFGEGVRNHHRDENTLEFFNKMTNPVNMDLESVLEEMYREYLIAASVTTLTIFTRQRLEYFPPKSEQPVRAQLQVPNVGVLPAENIRVLTNDVFNNGVLAYYTEDANFKRWLDEFFAPSTKGVRKAIMAMEEPIMATLFTGRIQVPMSDPDPAIRGRTLYMLNQRMVHRTTMPKGAMAYARPLLTRNFALLEAKRLLNIMDYSLLQGGTNYIVVAKKGTDNLPAQQPEIDNLAMQVTHASRSGVLVGDHRVSLEVITPDLTELLNPAKRKLLGRKITMAMLRQTEQVTADAGNQGSVNEMEVAARVITADRNKMLRHAQSTFYDETATRNRSVFKLGAPTIWAAKIILTGVKDFWSMLLNARDRGDIPRRWLVEQLGMDYEAGLAEREREIARGDDDILQPASVPFSNPGDPQDNNEGRPPGSSSNNGSGRDTPGQGKDPRAPRRTIAKNAGETVKAMVDGSEVLYFGEVSLALLEGAEEVSFEGYITALERHAIESATPQRSGQSIVVPVNLEQPCTEFSMAKLGDGLRVVYGKRVGDEAMIAKALRFTEPQYGLKEANDYALRWGFIDEPLIEEDAKKRRKEQHIGRGGGFCVACGNPVSTGKAPCPSCGNNPDTGETSGGTGPTP